MFIHRILIVSACIYCALLLGACSSTNSPTDEGKTGIIAGKVYSTETSEIVPQALITTVPPTASLFSGTDGSFRIDNVVPGAYVVQALKPGYGSGITSVTVLAGKSSTADILATKTATGLGIIAGVVTNEGGLAVGDAIVSTTPATGTVRTSSDGRYQLANVPPGTYLVTATSTDGSTGSISVAVLSDLAAQADIRMYRQDPSKARIQGTVLQSADNKPYVGAVVRVVEAELYDTTDQNGAFSFSNILPGLIHLEVRTVENITKIVAVTVEAGQIDTLTIRLSNTGYDDPNLYAYFPFDGNALDESGHGNNGLAEGNPTYGSDRLNADGMCINFDGTSQHIRINNASTLNELPLTIAFWLRLQSTPHEDAILLGKYIHPSGEGFSLYVHNSTLCAMNTRTGFTNYARACAKMPEVGKWVHVAAVLSSEKSEIYLDGRQISASAWSVTGKPSQSVADFYIGQVPSSTKPSGYIEGFNCQIDDFYIIKKALTKDEIVTLMNL